MAQKVKIIRYWRSTCGSAGATEFDALRGRNKKAVRQQLEALNLKFEAKNNRWIGLATDAAGQPTIIYSRPEVVQVEFTSVFDLLAAALGKEGVKETAYVPAAGAPAEAPVAA
jgi:hypothetical protein